MSAYIVSPSTIDSIVSALAYGRADHDTPRSDHQAAPFHKLGYRLRHNPTEPLDLLPFQRLAFDLYRMNVAAVDARYDEQNDVDYKPAIHFAPRAAPTAHLYKSVRCLRYQCAEGDVPNTPLYKALTEFSHELAHEIAGNAPAVEAAEWR